MWCAAKCYFLLKSTCKKHSVWCWISRNIVCCNLFSWPKWNYVSWLFNDQCLIAIGSPGSWGSKKRVLPTNSASDEGKILWQGLVTSLWERLSDCWHHIWYVPSVYNIPSKTCLLLIISWLFCSTACLFVK